MLWHTNTGETVIMNPKSLAAFVAKTLGETRDHQSGRRFRCLIPGNNENSGIIKFKMALSTPNGTVFGEGWVEPKDMGYSYSTDKNVGVAHIKNKKALKKALLEFYKDCARESLGL